jgi:hypothetical protein
MSSEMKSDQNSAAVRAFRHEITTRGHGLTEMRFLDLLIWSGQQPDLTSRG